MGFFEKHKIGFGAYEKSIYKGMTYKKVRSFGKEDEAEQFSKVVEDVMPSKRFPVLIDKIPVGLGLGYRYLVCVPVQFFDKVKQEIGG